MISIVIGRHIQMPQMQNKCSKTKTSLSSFIFYLSSLLVALPPKPSNVFAFVFLLLPVVLYTVSPAPYKELLANVGKCCSFCKKTKTVSDSIEQHRLLVPAASLAFGDKTWKLQQNSQSYIYFLAPTQPLWAKLI